MPLSIGNFFGLGRSILSLLWFLWMPTFQYVCWVSSIFEMFDDFLFYGLHKDGDVMLHITLVISPVAMCVGGMYMKFEPRGMRMCWWVANIFFS